MKKIATFFSLLLVCMSVWAQMPSFPPMTEPTWKDLDYVGDGLEGHKLDIYLPASAQGKSKVIIIIYGSAWFSNNAKAMTYMSLGKPLNDSGFAVVSINHRGSPEAAFPAQIQDVKAAIRFVRANAEKYNLDTSFVGITGFSSGGHLSSLAATTNGVKMAKSGEIEVDIEGKLGSHLDFSSCVDACVDWFGPLDMSHMNATCDGYNDEKSPEAVMVGGKPVEHADMCKLMDPAFYLDNCDPRFVVVHGDADTVVPYCQGVLFSERLMKYDKLEEFITVPGGGHGDKTFNSDTFKKMVDFFSKEAALSLR